MKWHSLDAREWVVIGATTIAALVPDPKVFRSGRSFPAWVGIVPRQERWLMLAWATGKFATPLRGQ
jgi:transposase